MTLTAHVLGQTVKLIFCRHLKLFRTVEYSEDYEDMTETMVKILLLGESGVGKTSLLLRYKSGVFKTHLAATFVDHYGKTIKVKDKEVNLSIWDTAGQETHRSIIRSYFRMADGVLLVYDVTNVTTFMKLSRWLSDLKSINETAEIIIAGNKNEDPSRKSVTVSTVRNFAREENLEYLEVSAKSGENVDKIFNYLIEKILAAKGIELCSQEQSPSDHEMKSTEKLKSSKLEDSLKSALSVQEQRLHPQEGLLTLGVVSSSTLETPSYSQSQEFSTFEENLDSVLQPSDSIRRISVCSAICALEYFDCLNENSSYQAENQLLKIQTNLDQKRDIEAIELENPDRGTIVRLHDETQICDEPKKKRVFCVIL